MTKEEFGERTYQLRSKMGLSQKEFEDLCGLARGYIGHIELGQRNPSLETMIKIAEGAGISLVQLLDSKPPQPKETDEYTNKIMAITKRMRPEQKRNALEVLKMVIKNQ